MRRLGLAVLVLLPTRLWAAGIPVIDVASIAQAVTQFKTQIMQYAEQLEQTKHQVEQIQNQMQQIQYAATTVQQGITNLAKLDVNKAADVLRLTDTLQSKLREAEYIGFQAQRANDAAQGLYPRIQSVMNPADQRSLYMQWADVRRAGAKVALKTQAIQDSQAQYQQQWADLMTKAAQAQGNLQIQQAQAQMQGLTGNQLLSIEQQLATQARMQSERALEEASRTELEQTALTTVTSTLDTTYTAQGKLLAMPKTGRE